MNEKNVAALRDAILDGRYPGVADEELTRGQVTDAHDLAAYLAAQGVLVPSVLTDAECESITDGAHGADDEYTRRNLHGILSRIAKGEA